jgi:hypothetical protein
VPTHNPAEAAVAATSARSKGRKRGQEQNFKSDPEKNSGGSKKVGASIVVAGGTDDYSVHYLMKSEPEDFSIDDLAKEPNQTTCWGMCISRCHFYITNRLQRLHKLCVDTLHVFDSLMHGHSDTKARHQWPHRSHCTVRKFCMPEPIPHACLSMRLHWDHFLSCICLPSSAPLQALTTSWFDAVQMGPM